jgi:hypothetical protein
LLEDALKRRLILTSDLKDRLFSYEKNGPLANFSAKINLGYAVGILTSDMRRDLDNIRHIRNRFAHTPQPLKFRDTKIKNWATSLITGKEQRKRETPRKRFLRVFSGMAFSLALFKEADIRLKEVFKEPQLRGQLDRAAIVRFNQAVDEFDAAQRASPKKS